jgi:DNA-binding NtrC family response regulator
VILVTTNDNNLDVLCVYTFVRSEDKHDEWLQIGVAVPHADGGGFSLTLRALPFEGRLILRRRNVEQEERGTVIPLAQQVEAFERAVIERCLLESGGRVNIVMERLNLPRRTLNEKMSRLGIRRHRLETGFKEVTADEPLRIGKK